MKSPPVLLLLLALTLTFFRPSSALAETTCVHGTCLSHPSPPKCFAAPTVPFRRRSLPHRNALLTRDEEPSARGLSSDALQPITVGFHTRRGNGICYYLKPRTGGALWQRVGQGSETFYLPAGLYALKWIAAQDPTRKFLPFLALSYLYIIFDGNLSKPLLVIFKQSSVRNPSDRFNNTRRQVLFSGSTAQSQVACWRSSRR